MQNQYHKQKALAHHLERQSPETSESGKMFGKKFNYSNLIKLLLLILSLTEGGRHGGQRHTPTGPVKMVSLSVSFLPVSRERRLPTVRLPASPAAEGMVRLPSVVIPAKAGITAVHVWFPWMPDRVHDYKKRTSKSRGRFNFRINLSG
jgi:hypothetical protein